MTRTRLRVALVDDHDLFRQGLQALLEKAEMEIAWTAGSAADAERAAAATSADVIVMDFSMPGVSGVEAARAILAKNPAARILIVSMHSREEFVVQALLAGVCGFALKTQQIEEIVAAIRATAEGRLYLAPQIPRTALDEFNRRIRRASQGVLDTLSPRERQVFDLVVQNRSTRAISEELKISIKTVETHRLALNKKLGVHSAAELVRFAAIHGLLH